jgi:TonB-linked SusC/RagA family outer membrane protein
LIQIMLKNYNINQKIMRYIQLRIVLCFVIITLFPAALIAQEDPKNNLEGTVKENDSLQPKGITVRSKDDNGFVQTAFRKVQKKDLLGGISYVDLPEIMEKNYTTYSLDGMQAYIGGFNGNIWSTGNYLVLVDGIPREASSVQAIEIEQVSFLKGVAAVALYGSRAVNGVVYITTKRGGFHKQKISVRLDSGLNVPKSYAKYLGSAEYMTYYNQARRNDGLDDLYSDETIYNYASGNNSYRYPNVDYYSSKYLKKVYSSHDANIEISGGNNVARYYTDVNFSTSGDLLKFGEAKNNRANRFNVRGNVDVNMNDFLSATVGVNAIYYNGRGVNADYWGSAATLRPYRFAPLVPLDLIEQGDEASVTIVNNSNYIVDGKYLLGGTQLDQTNPFAAIYAGGYNTYTNRTFQFNTGVNADLGSLLKGLSFHTTFGVDYQTSYNESYNNNYSVYEPSWNTYAGFDQITGLTKYGVDSKTGVLNISNSSYKQTVAFSGQFDYKNTFGGKHNVSAMLIANGFQQSQSEVYHKVSNANLGLNLSYNFDNKYYIDYNEALVHSAKLAEGMRNGFSNTVSLGWRISQENFMKNWSAIDNLKLSVSAGSLSTDIDIFGYYLYESIYTQNDGTWVSWRDGVLNKTTDSRRGENLDLTFIKRKELNVGLESSFLKKLIAFNGTFFMNRREGNIIQPSVIFPSYFNTGYPNSSFIPYVNYDNDDRVGFDFDLKFNKKLVNVNWTLGVTGIYYDTKASKRAENFENDYQNRQGKPLDAIFGLQNLGFFQDEADILLSPSQTFGQLKPGDIKYKDQNNDGIIDSKDEVYLGKAGWGGAPLSLGLNLTAAWKDFTFFALATGQFGAYGMKNSSYFWIDNQDKYSEVVRNSWTEATKETATFPRLTTLSSDNNYRSSDFWMYNTDRIDLSKVQVSYNLSKRILQKSFFNEFGVYVSGTNLLTISGERKTMELNVGSAPQTRFYNLGVKALF